MSAATALQALARKARASSRWRGGSTSTSGNASPRAASPGARAAKPTRRSASNAGRNPCSHTRVRGACACSAAPVRARRNSAGAAGQRAWPVTNGCISASGAGSCMAASHE